MIRNNSCWGIVILIIACGLIGCPAEPVEEIVPASGLYLGIIGFNENVTAKNIGLLNASSTAEFTGFIDALQTKPATGLYYAVDTAINQLQTASLPADLVNVSIVTFTDGLDNASLALNGSYNSRNAYRDAVKNRLDNTLIKGLNISAYSIGVPGNDVTDVQDFQNTLASLASSQDNVTNTTNWAIAGEKFRDIADSLYSESQTQSIKLRITGGYDDGTKIRFTFDDVNDAASSNLYIEGTFRRSDRSLQDIVYKGLTSSSGTTVSATISGVYVYYTFENTSAAGDILSLSNVRQWEYVASAWQISSESGQDGSSETIVEKKSAVIMLVLDCTTSLGAGFPEMKTIAKDFIDVLVGNDSGMTLIIPLERGKWVNGDIRSLSQFVRYSIDFSAGKTDFYIWVNDAADGDGTKTGDVDFRIYDVQWGTSVWNDNTWTQCKGLALTEDFSSKVFVDVRPRSSGTYSIVYDTNYSARPAKN